MKKNKRGITLIALVITIIVLLILAAVSIAMLSGDNSILKRAKSSVGYNYIGAAKDEVSLAYNSAYAKYLTNRYTDGTTDDDKNLAKLMADELKTHVARNNQKSHECKVEYSETQVSTVKLTYTDDQGTSYTTTGTLKTTVGSESFSWGGISTGTDNYPPDPVIPTNNLAALRAKIEAQSGDCMIDEKENIIPIDKWNYRLDNSNNTATLVGVYDDDDDCYYASYRGNVINGILEYAIPVFIKVNNKSYEVTELGDNTLDSLGLQSVNIPDTITTLGYDSLSGNKFTNLIIPDSVTTLGHSFISGNPLTELNLSNNIKMINYYAFEGCLLEVINIPSSVTEMGSNVFYNLPSSVTVNIPFKEDKIPSGWYSSPVDGWNKNTNAQIIYAK